MHSLIDSARYHAGCGGMILTYACTWCGCGCYYCERCEAVQEFEAPQQKCSDPSCGCHTDTTDELGIDPA